jgi:hypothetical protein
LEEAGQVPASRPVVSFSNGLFQKQLCKFNTITLFGAAASGSRKKLNETTYFPDHLSL